MKPDPLSQLPEALQGPVKDQLREQGLDPADVSSLAMSTATGDAPLPVLENEPPFIFVPGSGISSLDLTEIALMFVIQLVGGSVSDQGSLRRLAMQPQFREKLSSEAQRFMIQQKVTRTDG